MTYDPSYVRGQEETLERLQAMRQKEEKFYRVESPRPEICEGKECSEYSEEDVSNFFHWRRDMAQWCLDVTQLRSFPLEVAEVAMGILDMFLPHDEEVMKDSELFQLACMASFYLSCKVHLKKCMTMKQMEEYSCREFSREEFEYMEIHILYSIKWRVHPPTTVSFARDLLDLVPDELCVDRSRILDLVEQQVHNVLCDEISLTTKSSTIALAALAASLHPLLRDDDFFPLFHTFRLALMFDDPLSIESAELHKVLRLVCSGSLESQYFSDTASLSASLCEWEQRSTMTVPHPKEGQEPTSPRSVMTQ